jgi:hypothetical protein
MRSAVSFFVLVLSVPVALAQRGGGFGHGAGANPTGIARPGSMQTGTLGGTRRVGGGPYRGRGFGEPGFGRYGRERGFGYGPGYIWPYYPIWDYSSVTPFYYDSEFSNEYPEQYPPVYEIQGPPTIDSRAQPPRIASSVIHDYNFPKQAGGSAGETKFTIVLKDGSTRSAVASWVAGGQLHYIDPDSRQEALAPAAIDRKATEEANQAKNLSLVLPPD